MSETPLNHPTVEDLRALSLGQLGDDELARVAAHLGECAGCCRRIEELSGGDPLLARLRQSAASREKALVPHTQRLSAVRALRQAQGNKAAARQPDAQAQPVILPAPKQVGDYEILAEVGRGGMGVVYQARHRSLRRLVAIKMVLAGEFMSSAQETRFRLEAELAARVQHPNIVQVYEIGTHEGRPFLALEWVEGGSLASRLDGKPWPPGEAATLIETLARAIHVAHCEGVVHRDLKPANILLTNPRRTALLNCPDGSGEPSYRELSGTYKITDFGLAQPTEGVMTLTQSGFLVGTPGYMAPEQAGGKRALVGPATDIYALGVVLYQLLTGQLPFQGDSTLEVLRAVTSDEPVRPRRWQPRLPHDLEAITLHCLEKEPGHRYSTALALAEDLERFSAGRPVLARPVGRAARLARSCRRRPLVALLLALLTASLFGGLAGVTWKWLDANEQRDLANTNARQADDEKREAHYHAYRAHIAAAAAALQNHDVADAARQLVAVPKTLQGWEWRHLHSRLDDSSSVLPLPDGGVGFLLAGPDRLHVGAWTSAGLRITDLDNFESRILDFGMEVRNPQSAIRNVTVTQTRRGLRVAAWVGKTAFDLFDEAGHVLCRVESPEWKWPNSVVVSPDGARLVCGPRLEGEWTRLWVFDATSGKQTAVCDGHRDILWAYAFSPDGTRLVSAGEDRAARVWDPATGALLATCLGHSSKVLCAAFRPDGARLVTTSSDGTVRQWDTATGREVESPYDRHSGEVAAAVYSPDGQLVASAGTDRTIRVWQATGRKDVAVLLGHAGAVVGTAFSPDGRRLASLSSEWFFSVADGTVRVWDVDPGATLPVLRGHTRAVYPVAYSPDGRWLASGSWDTTVRLWDAATGEQCATLPHPGVVPSLAYGPDGSWLVSGTNADNRLRIWDAATGQIRKEIQGPNGIFRFVNVSPDGKRVAATALDPQSDKHHLKICDIASGERLFSAEGGALAYSPDGRWLAIRAADDKTVFLLNAQTHETAARFQGHEKFVFAAIFSPDSRLLASCGQDRTVRLWQIDSGACRVLLGHTDEVYAMAFHPDGTRLATGGRDRAVWLWDLARGEDVARLPAHTSFVWSLAFSRDGGTLVSGSGDATVRLWNTAPLWVRYESRRAAAVQRPQAERLVEQLWRLKNNPNEVVAALRADQSISEPLRQAALRAVLRKCGQPTLTDNGNDRRPSEDP